MREKNPYNLMKMHLILQSIQKLEFMKYLFNQRIF